MCIRDSGTDGDAASVARAAHLVGISGDENVLGLIRIIFVRAVPEFDAIGADEGVAEPTGGRQHGVLRALRAVVLAAFDTLLRLGHAIDAHVAVAPMAT